jgi:hypothetical protein
VVIRAAALEATRRRAPRLPRSVSSSRTSREGFMADRSQEIEPPAEVVAYYAEFPEERRLESGPSRLECERTKEILGRVLPSAPARIVDVGGAAGVYSLWLAAQRLRSPARRCLSCPRAATRVGVGQSARPHRAEHRSPLPGLPRPEPAGRASVRPDRTHRRSAPVRPSFGTRIALSRERCAVLDRHDRRQAPRTGVMVGRSGAPVLAGW